MYNRNRYLLAACCALALFLALLLALGTVDIADIGPMETKVGLSSLNQSARDALGESGSMYKISKLLGYLALLLAAGFALLGLAQWLRRKSLKKVDRALWALCALYVVTAALYVFFEKAVINYRPVLMEGETFPEPSFPSTHTMLACVIFCSAAMVCGQYLEKPALRKAARIACVVLAAVTVVCRLLSGVHWLTDILGGLLLSAALLSLFAAVVQEKKA